MRRRISIRFCSVLIVLGFLFSMIGFTSGCGEDGNIVGREDPSLGLIDSESSYEDTEVTLENLDDCSLVLKDNENYYYCVNRKNSVSDRYYIGKAYYRSSKYYYRGECKIINRSGKALSIYYVDSRYSKMILISVFWENNSGYGTLYFEPKDQVWSVSCSKFQGEF